MPNNFQFEWRVDQERNLYSPAGTWVGRLGDDCLYLYDKRLKTHIPFTLQDWERLLRAVAEQPTAPPGE